MAEKIIKLPMTPQVEVSVLRVKGRIVGVLDFKPQVFRDSQLVDATGKGKAKVIFSAFVVLNDDEPGERDYAFYLIGTGEDLRKDAGEFQYIGTALFALPDGNHLEYHLFFGGEVDAEEMGYSEPEKH